MHGTLNDRSSIYLQIARMLEDDILRGVWRTDEQIPSSNDLAKTLHINPTTAAKGINLLAAEGMIYKRRGLGMFVSSDGADIIRRKRQEAFYRDYVQPLVREGKSLEISGSDLLNMIRRAIQEEGTQEYGTKHIPGEESADKSGTNQVQVKGEQLS